MRLGDTLTIVIPVVILCYAAWLVWRMAKGRKRGKCTLGGCSGCPLQDGCEKAQVLNTREKQQDEDNPYE